MNNYTAASSTGVNVSWVLGSGRVRVLCTVEAIISLVETFLKQTNCALSVVMLVHQPQQLLCYVSEAKL